MKKTAFQIPLSALIAILFFAVVLIADCGCEESGGGDKTYDFSEDFNCLELCSAMTRCGISLVDPPWTDIIEACEGEYRPYFECVAGYYDPEGFCTDWLSDINSNCATGEEENNDGDGTDDDDNDDNDDE